jgi:cytochrome bd-type quinol oxidase subunit 1
LQYLLFEEPYALIPLVVVAAYACLVIWLRRRTPGAKRALIVALLLAVLLPVLQWWSGHRS